MNNWYTYLHLLILLCSISLLSACRQQTVLVVNNKTDLPRNKEMIETSLPKQISIPFVLLDDEENEVPYQITYDKKLIFQVTIASQNSRQYILKERQPKRIESKVFGQQIKWRKDDFAWENNCIAYRLYGPALQKSGEKAYGYDIWVKNTSDLIVAQRYKLEHDKHLSYHQNHGNGLDFYKVGPTLGAATGALLDAREAIVYPYCYKTYEILDNGPLRLTVRFTYPTFSFDNEKQITETRILSIDAGTFFNRMQINYQSLSKEHPYLVGITKHKNTSPLEDAYIAKNKTFISYANPKSKKEGQIFVSAIYPKGADRANTKIFTKDEQKERHSEGYVEIQTSYQPNQTLTYYWGAGWSKYRFPDFKSWIQYTAQFTQQLQQPLQVTFKSEN